MNGGEHLPRSLRLTPLQVQVTELLTRLGIRGVPAGFDLSHAVVPIIDLTRLLGVEPGGEFSQLRDHPFEVLAAAPHAATVRATRTLAPRERGLIRSANIVIQRVTAGTTGNTSQAFLRVTRSNAGAVLFILMARFVSNVVGANATAVLTTPIELFPGDVAELVTADDSVLGTVTYFGYMSLSITPGS